MKDKLKLSFLISKGNYQIMPSKWKKLNEINIEHHGKTLGYPQVNVPLWISNHLIQGIRCKLLLLSITNEL